MSEPTPPSGATAPTATDPPRPSVAEWLGALAVALVVAAVLVWAQLGGRPGSPQAAARLQPVNAFLAATDHLRAPDAFSRFNLPMQSVGVFLLWLVGVVAVGRPVAARLLPAGASAAETLGFAYASGFLMVGTTVFLAGWAGFANSWMVGAVLAFCAVAFAVQLRPIARLAGSLPPPFRRPWGEFTLWNALAAMLLVALAGGALYALTPPIQSDAMRYHLAAPQEFLKNGRIGFLPLNAFSNFPLLMQMHYMLALGARAPEAAQLMHMSVLAAAVLVAAAACRRFAAPLFPNVPAFRSDPAIALAAILAAAMPTAFITSAWPFADHALTLFVVAAVQAVAVGLFSGADARRPLALAGLMAAGAIGAKYTALPLMAALAALAVFAWAMQRPKRFWPGAMFGLVLGVALSAPWFARNFAETRNPVYPVANASFGWGGDWTPENATFYGKKMAEKGAPKTLSNLLNSPALATVRWNDYEWHYPGAVLMAALVAAAGGLWVAGRRRGACAPAFFAMNGAVAYVVWFFTYQSNRMLGPAVVLLAPAVCTLLLGCAEAARGAWRVAAGSLALACAAGFAWGLQWEYAIAKPSVPAFLTGRMSREKYVESALSGAAAFRWLEAHCAPGDRVLMVGEHRVYGAKFHAVWSDWFNTPVAAQFIRENGVRNPDEFIAALRRRGIRWILHNRPEIGLQLRTPYYKPRFSDDEWQIMEDALERPVFERTTVPPGVEILQLRDEAKTGTAATVHAGNATGATGMKTDEPTTGPLSLLPRPGTRPETPEGVTPNQALVRSDAFRRSPKSVQAPDMSRRGHSHG